MKYAFEETQHERAAHLRRDEAWRLPDLRVMVVGGEHIASHGGAGIRWVSVDAAPEGLWVFLGLRDGIGHAAVLVDRIPDELDPQSLRFIGPTVAPQDASLAVHAVGLARWHQTHRFCSRCGSETDVIKAGHSRMCPSCRTEHFPRTDPAVIMLITDGAGADGGGRAILGRQPRWPAGYFSTLAGFVEPGESVIDAVRREVMEEVGVVVGQVEYAGSQPWPFPSSLMLGFHGVAESSDITVDGDELEEARWFTREEITELTASGELMLPPSVSISRWLVERWHGGQISGDWTRP
ncbi:MAG TPA: NAD(+) diphosphatase [Aeromicrobium sp.]|nr:NAD(+) diphosphatase [Aeromicrobium sp.]